MFRRLLGDYRPISLAGPRSIPIASVSKLGSCESWLPSHQYSGGEGLGMRATSQPKNKRINIFHWLSVIYHLSFNITRHNQMTNNK